MVFTESDIQSMVSECINQLDEGKFSKALGAAALGGALALGNPTTANAQLNITNQTVSQPQKLNTLAPQIFLYKEYDGYRIKLQACGLEQGEKSNKQLQHGGALGATFLKQADKSVGNDYYLSLFLGKDETSAKNTLEQLIDIINKGIYQTEVSQSDGSITLTINNSSLYPKGLWIEQEGVNGYNVLSLTSIERALNFFDKSFDITSYDSSISWTDTDSLLKEYYKLKKVYSESKKEIKNSDDENFINIKKEQISKIREQLDKLRQELWDRGYVTT